MTTKMIHKVIYEPIFETETLFYVCPDIDRVISDVKNKYNVRLVEEEFIGASGLCWKLPSKISAKKQKNHCWFVWFEIPNNLRLTVHEAGHLAFNILNHHGIKCDFANQETYCYLLEFFTYELWEAMKQEQIKKKKMY